MRTAALSTIGITAIVCCIGCSTTADSQSNFASNTAQSNNASSGSTATSATTTTAPAGQETGATDARGGEGDGTRAAPLANGGPGPATAGGGGGANGGLALGGDADHPVPRCGPRDSYFFVATEFRCPDGTNPLNGDIAAGQRARAGNVGANNTTGHIIDLYTVPCASGPQRVYVDMYGCPQYASMFGGP